jgi:hypothetical protein
VTVAQALYLYRVVFAAFIIYASARTFLEGWPAVHAAQAGHTAVHIRILAATEIVAAAAFLWPSAQLWAGGALLAIFAIATVIELRLGGAPVRFAYYAATVAIVVFLDLKVRPGVSA